MENTKHANGRAHCVRLVPIFNHLDDESMDKIGSMANHNKYERGELIYQAEEDSDTLYIINKGKAKIYKLNENGKEQLIRILSPGDFTGEWSLFNPGEIHDNYAEAMVGTEICMIKREDFDEILEEYPAISMKLLSEMSKRLSQSEKQTTVVSSENVASRLAIYLVDLIEDHDEPEPVVNLGVARKDIASYLRTTAETISRKFKELESEGLITQLSSKEIQIHDVDGLITYD